MNMMVILIQTVVTTIRRMTTPHMTILKTIRRIVMMQIRSQITTTLRIIML